MRFWQWAAFEATKKSLGRWSMFSSDSNAQAAPILHFRGGAKHPGAGAGARTVFSGRFGAAGAAFFGGCPDL